MMTKEQAAAMKEQARKDDPELYKLMCEIETWSKEELQALIYFLEEKQKARATV